MELVLLAVVAILVAWKIGVFDMADEAVEMAKSEVREARRDQKARLVKRSVGRKIDEAEYKQAIANNSLLDAYDL